MFEQSAREQKLSLEECQLFKEAFKEGYFSEYAGQHTQAASEFFDLFYSVDKIHSIIYDTSLKEIEKLKVIDEMIINLKLDYLS